jgi:hypothetical protein
MSAGRAQRAEDSPGGPGAGCGLRPKRPGATLGSLFLLLAACAAPSNAAVPGIHAEFGIFYGGQVQERDEIPLSLDAARQRQGFRLTHTPPPAEPLEVRWELGKPGQGRRVPDSQGRRARPRPVQLGRAHFRAGEPVFEQTLPFASDDPLGLWNIRVLVGDRVVLERPFVVYDPVERERREKAAVEADGGF